MFVLRPDGRLRLYEQLLTVCAPARGEARRTILVFARGQVLPESLEPFATLARILGDELVNELRLVLTDGWPPAFWPVECGAALEAADVEGVFELNPTPDQRRRALTQHVDDGRLEVLFVERGRIVGSALTLVARRSAEGPIPLNAKLAAMELLQAARDAMGWEPRSMRQLVQDAREALGIPAGPTTSIAEVRAQRGQGLTTPPVTLDNLGELLRASPDGLPRTTSFATEPRRSPGVNVQEVSYRRPAPAPRPAPAAPVVRPEDRHAIEGGRCTHCGRQGVALQQPCGRPDLGRIGLIELD